MGRSILVVLLVTIIAISRMSNNPTPVPITFAPRCHCCLAAVSKGEGTEGGTLSQQGLR